jgi:hypothetical protein
MRKNFETLMCLWLLLAFWQTAYARDTASQTVSQPVMPSSLGPVIFIAPLEADTNQIPNWQPASGLEIARVLIKGLEGLPGRFRILDITGTNELQDELRWRSTNATNEATMPETNDFDYADFMFVGTVAQMTTQTNNLNGGNVVPGAANNGSNIFNVFANTGAEKYSVSVEIEWRIEDTCTGKTIRIGTAEGRGNASKLDATTNAVAVGNTQVGSVAAVTNFWQFLRAGNGSGFADTALGKAAFKASVQIARQLMAFNPPESGFAARRKADGLKNIGGAVLLVPDKTNIIVSLGSEQGWKAGDALEVYQPIPFKDASGVVVYIQKKDVGKAILEDVQDKSSMATYDGSITAEPGWIVKAK